MRGIRSFTIGAAVVTLLILVLIAIVSSAQAWEVETRKAVIEVQSQSRSKDGYTVARYTVKRPGDTKLCRVHFSGKTLPDFASEKVQLEELWRCSISGDGGTSQDAAAAEGGRGCD